MLMNMKLCCYRIGTLCGHDTKYLPTNGQNKKEDRNSLKSDLLLDVYIIQLLLYAWKSPDMNLISHAERFCGIISSFHSSMRNIQKGVPSA